MTGKGEGGGGGGGGGGRGPVTVQMKFHWLILKCIKSTLRARGFPRYTW